MCSIETKTEPTPDREIKKDVKRVVSLSFGAEGKKADFLLQIECRDNGSVAIEMPFLTQTFSDLLAAKVWLSGIDLMNDVLKRNLSEMLDEVGAPRMSGSLDIKRP